ncbi:MAG TPA: hypothetical protein VM532_06655 [Burkholderiales bacterium]|nr:hypothetical protein [Burkholderiales bacterium]
MKSNYQQKARTAATILTAILCAGPLHAVAQNPAPSCPLNGWQEGLNRYLKPTFPFPTSDTANDTPATPAPDCVFQQWSAEAFVWATALGSNGVPRFMTLPTPDQLLPKAKKLPPKGGKLTLKLAARSLSAHGTPGFTEGAGAIVEADGNVLVSPNGYPVYASVHMNPSYFATAQKNLLATGGYLKQPADSYFDVGAAVFKATWLRLGPNEKAPAGAYTTQAQVPVLNVLRTQNSYAVVPIANQFTTVTVALVGLHVVGYTENHPEFLWATFEHRLNSPRTPDNQFNTSGSSPTNYTFYAAGTSYAQVNQPNPPQSGQSYTPPQLWFDPVTQKFSPSNNVVLENQTGGTNFPNGAADIANVSSSMQRFFTGLKSPQSVFGNYDLIGTVWLEANSYTSKNPNVLKTNASNAIGSVNLANSTAETFQQYASNSNAANVQNCFMCHNPTTLSGPGSKFPPRRISISHVLEVGTPQAVQNLLIVPITKPQSK